MRDNSGVGAYRKVPLVPASAGIALAIGMDLPAPILALSEHKQMATAPAPITDPMACLQGAYEHLATKADWAQMETRMTWRLIGASGAIIAAVALLQRFL